MTSFRYNQDSNSFEELVPQPVEESEVEARLQELMRQAQTRYDAAELNYNNAKQTYEDGETEQERRLDVMNDAEKEKNTADAELSKSRDSLSSWTGAKQRRDNGDGSTEVEADEDDSDGADETTDITDRVRVAQG